ncbi:MAG TPA: alpha/beta family hydrolase [Thermoanaerobaculia bacterium]|nr:alpha/beta family hydrolase [Thermoanaerobaculia bacterium]
MEHDEFLADGPPDGPVFIFAHGAGGAMDTPFMNRVAAGLADRGIRVLRFEFPYMRARREGKRSGAPDRQPILLESWRDAIRRSGATRPFIGGKSLGGRMASMVADEMNAAGLICFGYPFHPPGNPERTRVEHLRSIATPTVIIQGERDPFGTPEEVAGYGLAPTIRVEWLPDGDHSFKPRRASGVTETENVHRAIELAGHFIGGQD